MLLGLTDAAAATVVLVTAGDIRRGKRGEGEKGKKRRRGPSAHLSAVARAHITQLNLNGVRERATFASECTCPGASWILFAPPSPPPPPPPPPPVTLLLPFSYPLHRSQTALERPGRVQLVYSEDKETTSGEGGRRRRRRRRSSSPQAQN